MKIFRVIPNYFSESSVCCPHLFLWLTAASESLDGRGVKLSLVQGPHKAGLDGKWSGGLIFEICSHLMGPCCPAC